MVIGGLVVGGLVLGIVISVIVERIITKTKAKALEQQLEVRTESAKRQAENIIKSAELDAASEIIRRKEEFSAEVNKTKQQLQDQERRQNKHQDTLDRQAEQLLQRENQLKDSERDLNRKKQGCESKNKHLSTLIAQQKNQLLKITSMDIEKAKDLLLTRLEDECEHEMSAIIQRKIEETEETVEEKSREIISTAIQRYAAEQTCEVTVSMIDIPSDDMKGRIIGRCDRRRHARHYRRQRIQSDKERGSQVEHGKTHPGRTNTPDTDRRAGGANKKRRQSEGPADRKGRRRRGGCTRS